MCPLGSQFFRWRLVSGSLFGMNTCRRELRITKGCVVMTLGALSRWRLAKGRPFGCREATAPSGQELRAILNGEWGHRPGRGSIAQLRQSLHGRWLRLPARGAPRKCGRAILQSHPMDPAQGSSLQGRSGGPRDNPQGAVPSSWETSKNQQKTYNIWKGPAGTMATGHSRQN